MVIKRLETDDEIRGKAYVHCQAWKEAYTGLIDQSFLDNRTLEMSQERAFRAFQDNVPTLIAKDGNNVIGFVDYGKYRWDDLQDSGEVYAIYLLKEYYGKGIGHDLMEHALQNLKEYKRIAVWVLEGNERAIRFYKKFGYDFDGKKLITTLGTEVTELRMILKPPQEMRDRF